jgi:hypothetical protein
MVNDKKGSMMYYELYCPIVITDEVSSSGLFWLSYG